MALNIKPLAPKTRFGPLRGVQAREFLFTGDASKPTGGYTILATSLGFTYLDFAQCGDPQASADVYAGLRIGTASTDCTLQYFFASATSTNAATMIGGALTASAAPVSTNPVACLVIGRL